MVSIKIIQQRIASIIEREEEITREEIAEFEQKQHDNNSCYGLGGWYTQFQKAIDRRLMHLEELVAVRKANGNPVILQSLRLYAYYCPTCGYHVYLEQKSIKDIIDCPICHRDIFQDGDYTEWQIQKDSRYTKLRR